MFELLALSLLIMCASLAGVLLIWGRVGSFVESNLDYLVSFSAGVFLIFLYGLASEAIEHSGGFQEGLPWLLAGAVGIWLVFKFLPAAHVHLHEGHSHDRIDARRMITTDAIHNTADGIFLAASYAVSPTLALAAGISIFVHEALQEISEFFVLRDAGYSTRMALGINFFTASTILIGSIGGYFLLDAFEALEGPLLGIAAGGLLVVVLGDLIPHSVREARSHMHYAKHLFWFVIGFVVMAAVVSYLPHAEPEESESHEVSLSL